ncbi:hypothetical protein CF327_g2831 [Tilletia walkeri]|nr:hypothetical protein CF327_g2831 [Tilletia walkeri]
MTANGPPADPSGPFEGPEKLLELWFSPPPSSSSLTLRSVSRDSWQTILNTVSCTILSVLTHSPSDTKGSPPCDAYLLSESSMFVFDHKLILKTCGTTTLLLGLEHILHLAHHVLALGSSPPLANELQAGDGVDARLGAQLVERVFYSRKSFMFPDRQKGPHKDWMLEVALLDDFFNSGAAYTVGKMNGDHWLLYMAGQDTSSPSSSSSTTTNTIPAPLAAIESPPHNDNEDQTLEILMTHLDPAATQAFYFAPPPPPSGEEEEDESARSTAVEGNPHASLSAVHQQATTKGGAASADEPTDDDEEADPGPISTIPNGTVGHALTDEQQSNNRGHALGAKTSAEIGLASLFSTETPASQKNQLDAFAFEPCGYSANALISPSSYSTGGVKHTAGYWTVHVTPEPECSYASFETNVRFLPGSTQAQGEEAPHNITSLIRCVVDIFQPGKMSITLFLSSSSSSSDDQPSSAAVVVGGKEEAETNAMALDALVLKGYRRTDRILYEFEGYDLTFVTFEHVGLGERKVRMGLA